MMRLAANCVSWPRHRVSELIDMIEHERDITQKTFKHAIGPESYRDIEAGLGYGECPGLTLGNDWSVTFHSGNLAGQRVYYVRHSGIEYVFTNDGTLPGAPA